MDRLIKSLMLTVIAVFLSFGQGYRPGSSSSWPSLITYGSSNKTRLMRHIGNVYLDTSTTGQAGSWKRIDNTSDSCSNPFLVGSDSMGTYRPVHEESLFEKVKQVHATLGLHVYRIQTKELVYDLGAAGLRWTGWTMKGVNSGYGGQDYQDSVLQVATGNTSNVQQRARFWVDGIYARLCPDIAPTTSTSSGDSTITDSTHYVWR